MIELRVGVGDWPKPVSTEAVKQAHEAAHVDLLGGDAAEWSEVCVDNRPVVLAENLMDT